MKIFVGNFEFEHRLAGPIGTNFPKKVLRINAELGPLLAIAAADGDYVKLPEPIDKDFASHLVSVGMPAVTIVAPFDRDDSMLEFMAVCLDRGYSAEQMGLPPTFRRPVAVQVPKEVDLCPWGWTPEWRRRAGKEGWRFDAPEQAAVLAVNSRRFSFEIEEEWQCGLEGARSIRTLDELDAAVERLPAGTAGWVVKAEFGMSARERVIGRCGNPSHQARNWIERRIGAGTKIFFEPWVERIGEIGMQFTIPETGSPVLDGVTPLLCDAQGQYRGSRFAEDPSLREEWSDAIAVGLDVAVGAQAIGYFGPMGIDAMRYRDAAGNERVRPLQDINGRMTMGRVSLGLRRVLKAGEFGSWLHLRCPATSSDQARRWYDGLGTTLPDGVRSIRTSPLTVGEFAVQHATLAIMADDVTALHEAERRLLNPGNS